MRDPLTVAVAAFCFGFVFYVLHVYARLIELGVIKSWGDVGSADILAVTLPFLLGFCTLIPAKSAT